MQSHLLTEVVVEVEFGNLRHIQCDWGDASATQKDTCSLALKSSNIFAIPHKAKLKVPCYQNYFLCEAYRMSLTLCLTVS